MCFSYKLNKKFSLMTDFHIFVLFCQSDVGLFIQLQSRQQPTPINYQNR